MVELPVRYRLVAMAISAATAAALVAFRGFL